MPENIKVSIVLFMKKTLPIGKSKMRLFLQLQKEVRLSLKITLLKTLSETQSPHMANMISDLIAEIASSLYKDKQGLLPESEKWLDLFDLLKRLFATQVKQNILSVMRILESII